MVDIEKLSGLTEDKKEESGINIMDAIKGVTGLIKEAKGLQQEFQPKQDAAVQQIAPVAAPPIQAITPTPAPVAAPVAAPVVVDEEKAPADIEETFNKIMQALDMGVLIYGNIPVEEFKANILKDKVKILTMISGLM